jgi:two-component system, OmpR family, sensor histidine kinase KdpD
MNYTIANFTRPSTRPEPVQYALAFGTIVVISIGLRAFTSVLGYQAVSLILLFAVALLSLKFEVGPVLAAASASAVIWNFFFIPPHFTLAIASPQDALLFITYFVIAAITGTLTARIRSRENRAIALFTLTKELIDAKTQDEVARAAVDNIGTFFNAEVLLYLSEHDGDIFTHPHPASTLHADEKEYRVASWVYWNEKKAGKHIDRLPYSVATYYPISGPRYPLGVLGIRLKSDKPVASEQETLLQNFIGQIASALEREQLNELSNRTTVYMESERLYKTLFNSISHELRTPIAAILSAAEGLQSALAAQTAGTDASSAGTAGSATAGGSLSSAADGASADRSMRSDTDFLGEIHTAADRLNRLVENLLDMTRLESGHCAPTLDWCDIRDIINASLKKLETELKHHRVSVSIADDVPLVKLDFELIEQALTNLLHNASIYTPEGSTVTIETKIERETLVIAIHDNGPGFPSAALPKIFDKFFRIPGSKAGGTGLGLSIVRGYVEAHKGTITALDTHGGGAQFILRIPTVIHKPE